MVTRENRRYFPSGLQEGSVCTTPGRSAPGKLDIFWLKDESLEASENLPEPDILAREIVEDLQDALAQFQLIADDLGEEE